jgi:hypothetical protein
MSAHHNNGHGAIFAGFKPLIKLKPPAIQPLALQ